MPYWVKVKTGVKGPYSRAQLDVLRESGKISDRSLISQAEDGPWQRLAVISLDDVPSPAPLMDYEDTSAKIHMGDLWSRLGDQMQSDDPAKAIEVIEQLEQCDLTADEREDLASMRVSLTNQDAAVPGADENTQQETDETPLPDLKDDDLLPDGDQETFTEPDTGSEIPQELLELLNDAEEVLFNSRSEPLVLYASLAITGMIGAVLSTVVFMQAGLPGILLSLGFVFAGFCKYLSWKNTVFMITTSRIFARTGIFSRSIDVLPIRNVQAVKINTGTIDRWLGLNKVVFLTGASFPVPYLGMIGTVCFRHVDCKEVMRAFESGL
ncbi:MAG: PH domain-containing protein [Rhodopirellula sp.]|nr:PH domain-containing protein [Rhodopirellula sp.]